MTTWRRRPRISAALAALPMASVVVAMLFGAVLAGDGPSADDGSPRTQR
jgi:hypothetical protein